MARKTTIKTVDKGEFGHIYPLTVVYQVGKKNYILAEDEGSNYLIKPIYDNGTLGESIVVKNFGRYYDIMQAAYDDLTATTYLCAVSLESKSMELFSTTNGGLISTHEFNFEIEDRKTFNFFFISGRLYIFQGGEDANGKYTVRSIAYSEV
ncbi:MAG: hypothetical protein RR510_03980 [Morganella sp. (in: enterobacteria)]